MIDAAQLTGKQRQFIQLLQQQRTVESLRAFCHEHGFDINFINGFLRSGLLTPYLTWQERTQTAWTLTAKGASLKGQVPGVAMAVLLQRGVTNVSALQTPLGATFSTNFGALRKTGLVSLFTQGGSQRLQVLNPAALAQYPLRQTAFDGVVAGEPPTDEHLPHLEWLQTQGYVTRKVQRDYALQVQPSLQTIDIRPVVTTLTSPMLLSGDWQQVDLKPYDIHTPVASVSYGQPAVLSQCIHRIRDIFLNMGFDEMAGYIVESAFWNFDALFTPQDHPAREVQDTFYLANPQTLPLPEDDDLVKRVQQVHEASYGGTWTPAEASRAMLRAHTTSSTARRLHQIQGEPGKYFSIDKVFRNETPDRTHLVEFHQIEGVIVGELLSVRTLMGYLIYFYERLGFSDLKFKPTYNPYTEPSLEVLAYHAPSDRYLEVGNSGLFRQEMLEPLGCGHRSTVAWGLGLERIAMLLTGTDRLSDLVGPESRLPLA